MKILTCENLSVSYGANQVLENLSFFAKSGECLGILGENGAGKSTLLKCLLGLKKADGGEIKTEGFTLSQVGYLPQQTELKRDFPASVFEVVLSGCLNMRGKRPFYLKREKQTATENLIKMEAEHLKKRSFSELSGGEQQRVLLARALCCAEKLLILDEPTAGLDPIGASEMYALINKLKNEENVGIIMVSHDTMGALLVSDRVLHITKDRDCFFGTKEEYKNTKYVKNVTEGTLND
ncbi:MAG: metal ABC transporter ATP-binding protein [Clostridia bacterium]|nr:metal ABC transporter ATP-binding protein [Clostridia bacterium]